MIHWVWIEKKELSKRVDEGIVNKQVLRHMVRVKCGLKSSCILFFQKEIIFREKFPWDVLGPSFDNLSLHSPALMNT